MVGAGSTVSLASTQCQQTADSEQFDENVEVLTLTGEVFIQDGLTFEEGDALIKATESAPRVVNGIAVTDPSDAPFYRVLGDKAVLSVCTPSGHGF